MAYPVELEIKLSTKEAERKLNEMQAKAAGIGGSSETSKGLNDISAGLKQLRGAIGGNAIASSLADLVKEMGLFDGKTTEIVNSLSQSFNRVIQAASTGNVYVVALVGALETLRMVWKHTVSAAREETAAMQKSLEAQMDRTRKWRSFRREVDDYRENKEVNAAVKSGDIAKIGPLLEKYATRQQATQQTIDEMYSKGWHTSRIGMMNGLISQAKEYDSIVEVLKNAIRKKVKTEQEEAEAVAEAERKKQQAEKQRIEDLEKARESLNWNQRLKTYGWDESFLQNELTAAKEQMEKATTAQELNSAASRAT